MNNRFKKWIWKISGADKEIKYAEKCFESAEESRKRLIEKLEKQLEPVKPDCVVGDWCKLCENRYETFSYVYDSHSEVLREKEGYGCKLKISCVKFKEDSKE